MAKSKTPAPRKAPSFLQKTGSAFAEGARNIGPQFLDTINPANLPKMVGGLGTMANAIGSLDLAYSDPDYAKKHPEEAALLDYFKEHYSNYGSLHGIAQNVGHDPLGTLSDAALAVELATAPFTGGASLAAAPVTSGLTLSRALSIANKAAKFTGHVTSPLLLPTEAVKLAAPTLNRIAGAVMPRIPRTNIVDSMGVPTQQTIDAITQAYGDQVNPREILRQHPGLVTDLQRTGITPANVRQSVAKQQGVTLTRSQSTGRAPPRAAAGIVNDAATQAASDMAAHARGIISAPSRSLGESLSDAINASRQRIKDRYATFTAIPGEFGPEFSGDVRTSINGQLSQHGIDMGDLREKPSGILPAAQMGIAEIDRVIKNLESGKTVSAVQVNDAAKTLNTLYKGAAGYDRELLNSLRHGFYDAVKDISNSNFSGDQTALSDAFKAARNAHETHANTFMGEDDLGSAARDVTRGNIERATTSLGSLIVDPRTGRMVPGADEAMTRMNDIGMGHGVNEHVRHTIANAVADPNVPHAVSGEAINNPLLYADEAERLRALNATKGIISETPPPSGEWTPGRGARLATGAVIGAGAGILAKDLTPLGSLAWPVASGIGAHLENQAEHHIIGPMERRAEAAGAPVERRPFTPLRSDRSAPEAAVKGILSGANTAAQYATRQSALANEKQPEPVQMSTEELLAEPTGEGDQRVTPDAPRGGSAPVPAQSINPLLAEPTGEGDEIVMPDAPEPHFAGGRVGRASGGQVKDLRKHEFLVNRLMLAAKNAKKVTDKTTEPLLNVPDEHIVKALDVAQRAI